MALLADFFDTDLRKKFSLKNEPKKDYSPKKSQKNKTIFTNAHSNPHKNKNSNNLIPTEKATAPYNFISLPERVLPSPIPLSLRRESDGNTSIGGVIPFL